MKVILLGQNMAHIGEIKTKDLDKHFYQFRGQLYRIYPQGLTRMRIIIDGVETDSDEVYVFPENALVPHHPHDLDYSNKAIRRDIDIHKYVAGKGAKNMFKYYVDTANSIWKGIAPFAGLIVAGIVVAWAFISG